MPEAMWKDAAMTEAELAERFAAYAATRIAGAQAARVTLLRRIHGGA